MPGEKHNAKEQAACLHSLALFRELLGDGVIGGLLAFLEGDGPARLDLYCEFVSRLYRAGGDFGNHLLHRVLESDNAAVRLRATGADLPPFMERALNAELSTFTTLSALLPEDLAAQALTLRTGAALPLFKNTYRDFVPLYTRRLAEISSRGFGVFAFSHMLTLGASGGVVPVKNPDPQRLSQLIGYNRERGLVQLNTRALLRGLPAANILLYGDAGTGKSSTVKAVANEYQERGLRLIEVRKNQITRIPSLMDELAENPLKFILFIDDLSFSGDGDDFTALKAILEGNVAARPQNIVVYATSNRRHMLRETGQNRLANEVNLADTLEEESSLAARFGLTVTFLKPDRELFAAIVSRLASESGLRTPMSEVLAKAEVHVLRQGGRSPRAARQFIELLCADEEEGGGNLQP